jgi:hypothetical protein
MNSIISKEFLPTKNNVFVWLNAVFLIVLLLIGKTEPLTVVMAYFLETIVVGVIHSFKIYKTSLYSGERIFKTIVYFLSQYLFFVAVQLIFVFAFLKFYDTNISEAYFLKENIIYVLNLKGMWLVLASIVMCNIADYIINFLLPNAHETTFIKTLIKQPYNRILVQQLAVIVACFFFFFTSGILVVAILLILIRTWMELYFQANSNENIL